MEIQVRSVDEEIDELLFAWTCGYEGMLSDIVKNTMILRRIFDNPIPFLKRLPSGIHSM